MNSQSKPWLVERRHRNGTWHPVEPFLSEEQARTVADAWSWQRNAWHRARFVVEVANG
jgi:hypothetical protein